MESNNLDDPLTAGPSTRHPDVTIYTRNPTHVVPVRWHIENALTFSHQQLTSPLRIDPPCRTKVDLLLKFDPDHATSTEVSVGFCRRNRRRHGVALKYDLSLQNLDGYVYARKTSDAWCDDDDPFYCLSTKFTRRPPATHEADASGSFLEDLNSSRVAVLNEGQSVLYRIPEDVLVVEGMVSVTGCCTATHRVDVAPCRKATTGGGSRTHLALKNDFLRAYENRMYTDLTIVLNNLEYHAHRFVLAARSPELKKILEPTVKNSPGPSPINIDISGVSNHIFEVVLEFLYCGEVEVDPDSETLRDMYEVGVKWRIVSLVEECRRILLEDMTEDTACKVLVLADIHGDDKMSKGTIKFIAKRFHYIKETEEYKRLMEMHPRLVIKILNQNSTGKRRT